MTCETQAVNINLEALCRKQKVLAQHCKKALCAHGLVSLCCTAGLKALFLRIGSGFVSRIVSCQLCDDAQCLLAERTDP
eukprot:316928-Amphidinium_carterae.1